MRAECLPQVAHGVKEEIWTILSGCSTCTGVREKNQTAKRLQKKKGKIKMTEAQILAKTYQDNLTVKRKQHTVAKSGESVFKEVLIYENIPCALSQSGGSTPEKDGNKRTADRSMTIFASPEIIMKDMDSITVETSAGQVFRGHSGRTFAYANSHGETAFKIETIA